MVSLSIITINYNNAEGLRKTIESVLCQTSKEIEYIVIDGGSTDGSVEVIKEYTNRINYWVSEPDRGIYHAMNKGILIATGQYCQFLNSGDYLLSPTVTEQMLQGVQESHSILYGNILQELDGCTYIERSYEGKEITLLNLYLSTIPHSSAYIKRCLFDKYGLYDESLKIVSDWKFYLISVGLNNEQVFYQDINVSWFDMTGISSTNRALDRQERALVLEMVLPKTILLDYQNFAIDSIFIKKLKKNRLTWFLVVSLYRLLFWSDKLYKKII